MKKFVLIAVLALAGLVLGRFVYVKASGRSMLTVNNQSMVPTLNPGESVYINRYDFENADPAKDDIVAFEVPAAPNVLILGRVKGLPGETLGSSRTTAEQVTLSANEFFVVGDNEKMAIADSYTLGPIQRDQIKGKITKD